MAKKPRENRIPIMMSGDELTGIDDWRFNNRIATRSDAVRRLCKIALILEETVPATRKATDELVEFVFQFSDTVDALVDEMTPEHREAISDLSFKLLKHTNDIFDAQISEAAQIGYLRHGDRNVDDEIGRANQVREMLRGRSALKLFSSTPGAREALKRSIEKAREAKDDKPDE